MVWLCEGKQEIKIGTRVGPYFTYKHALSLESRMMGNYHVRFGKGFLANDNHRFDLSLLGPIYYFTLIIAVPTGIKIFSWLSTSFSKRYLTKYNIKGSLPATCPLRQGNLNNSSAKGHLNIGYKRVLVSPSIFKLREGDFSLYRCYSTGPSQVDLDVVTKIVNEYGSDCFYISIYKSNKHKMGEGVTLGFYISLKDENLIKRLQLALGGCGQILKRNDSFIFRVQDSLSISEKIIPFFNKACLQGRKLQAFES